MNTKKNIEGYLSIINNIENAMKINFCNSIVMRFIE